MFTGIITETGRVKNFIPGGVSARLEIACKTTAAGLGIGDSVAVNGVCLSITDIRDGLFFDVIGNTLERTNLKRLKPGDTVNLEGALRLGDALSGHMVSGHVDGERMIRGCRKTPKGWALDITALPGDKKYVLPRGSIAVDGVSLTVGEVLSGSFRIFLIPHTLSNTTLRFKKKGEYVNVEFDMMAKYAGGDNRKEAITENTLREKGFM